jgi:hypothetical protein
VEGVGILLVRAGLGQQHRVARLIAAGGPGFPWGRHVQHRLHQSAVPPRPFQLPSGVLAKRLGVLLHRRAGAATVGEVRHPDSSVLGLCQLHEIVSPPASLKQITLLLQDGAKLLVGLGLSGAGGELLLVEEHSAGAHGSNQNRQRGQQAGCRRVTPHPPNQPLAPARRTGRDRLAAAVALQNFRQRRRAGVTA